MEGAAEAQVATRRITSILLLPEIGALSVESGVFKKSKSPPSVEVDIHEADFSWSEAPGNAKAHIIDVPKLAIDAADAEIDSTSNIELKEVRPSGDNDATKSNQSQIRGISLSVKAGELVVVVGPVGCGKTTLLEAVLGRLLQ